MPAKDITCPACGIALRRDVGKALAPASTADWMRRCKDRWAQPSQCQHLRKLIAASQPQF